MDRREVMRSLLLAASAGFWLPACDPKAPSVTALADGLVCGLEPRSAITELGQRYLAQESSASGVPRVMKALLGDLPPEGMTVSAAQERLKAAIAADYAEGRLVKLDRWLLSETEARLAALKAQAQCRTDAGAALVAEAPRLVLPEIPPAAPIVGLAAAIEVGPILPEGVKVKAVAKGFSFLEGPACGPDGHLWFCDVPKGEVHRLDVNTEKTQLAREGTHGAGGMAFDGQGRMYLCEGKANRVTRVARDEVTNEGAEEVLAERYLGRKLNAPNDLVLDQAGGLYFSDPRYQNRDQMELKLESVFYIDAAGALTRVITELKRPNGLALSPDGKTLYVVDHMVKRIHAYPVKGPGLLGEGKLFTRIHARGRWGGADGLTMDVRGNVYAATGNGVEVFNPAGKRVHIINVPQQPTNVAFAGHDKRVLYITTGKVLYKVPTLTRGL